jgi:hypothetical protein
VRRLAWVLSALLSFFCLGVQLTSCSTPAATPAPAAPGLAWQVQVLRYEIKDSLNIVESVTQYNGSKIDVNHTQSPAAGKVYLLVEVSVRKTDPASAAAFDWQYLGVRDASGNLTPRLSNDTFLEQYQYAPRITGLELRFGETRGWMGFEIPASASGGSLSLVYSAPDSPQESVLQK